MLHALPVLSGLRHVLPGVGVDWVVEDRAADLLGARSDLGRVVVFPRRTLQGRMRRPWTLPRPTREFVEELRAVPYDAAIDLQGNLKSGLIARWSDAAVRFGMDRRASREGNHLFLTRRALPPSSARHRVERNLALVSQFLGRPVPYVPPGFPTRQEDAPTARLLLAKAGLPSRGYVVLHPGTSGFGSFKRWPEDRWTDLAIRLRDAGEVVALTCAPSERPLAERVSRRAQGALRVVECPDLLVLAEVLRGARQMVSADTGPLHLAALLGTPVLGLFGPKDPAVYGPYGLRSDGSVGLLPVLVREDVACRPCTLRRCSDPICMRTIDPAEVLPLTIQP